MMRKKTCYFDTSIWVAYLRDCDEFHAQGIKLMRELEQEEKSVLYMSDLVSLEVMHVMRYKIIEDRKSDNNTDKMESDAKNVQKYFLSKIKQMEKAGSIKYPEIKTPVDKHYKKAIKKSASYFGNIITVIFCNNCNGKLDDDCECSNCENPSYRTKYFYKGLGHVDLEHALYARDYGVDDFYTFDRSFEDLKTDKDFKGITFHVF